MSARLLRLGAAIAFFALATPASAAVNLIQNGSFETGSYDNSNSNFNTLSGGSSALTSWTIGGFGEELGSIDWINNYWQPGDGNRSIDLSGLSRGSVSQSFSAIVGQEYTLSFLLSGNTDGGPAEKQVGVDVAGNFQIFSYNTVIEGNSRADMKWQPFTFTFVADDTTETLKFTSLVCASGGDNPCAFGPALDNVSVSAVPELSTWMMMLTGFAGIGFVAFRRERTRETLRAGTT